MSAVASLDVQHTIKHLCLVSWCSLARENAKLRENAREEPVGAPIASSSNGKSDLLFSQRGATDTTLVRSSAAQSSQKMTRAPKVVPTRIQDGTTGSSELVDGLDMPERPQSSEFSTSTCAPASNARRVKGREMRPVKHDSEAPDDLLDTAILEWQNLCESLSADALHSHSE